MDLRLALMCGIDIPIPECQLVIHQPTIKEISYIGEKDFLTGVQCICINRATIEKDNFLPAEINNFQIFMTIMNEKETADKKEIVKSTFTLFFPKYQIMFTPRSIIFRQGEQSIVVDETTFDFLQQTMILICCLNKSGSGNENYNPQSKKAKEIADKLMRGRQRIAAEKGEGETSIFSQYLSVLTVGIASMSLQDVMNLTMYQLYDLIERYSLYINWDIDIRSRLAGAKIDKEPDNWMKNIH